MTLADAASLLSRPNSKELVVGKKENHAPGDQCQPHRHPCGQLTFSLSGSVLLSSDLGTQPLNPGQAIWLPPEATHSFYIASQSELCTIFFDDSYVFDSRPKVLMFNGFLQALTQRICSLSETTQSKPSHLKHLLSVFNDEMYELENTKSCQTCSLPKDTRLKPLLDAVKEHPNCPPSPKDILKLIPMSGKTLSRIFINELGIPYSEWRQQWRFERAQALLQEGWNSKSIWGELEFSSDSAFISFFKKRAGITPKSFRASLNDN